MPYAFKPDLRPRLTGNLAGFERRVIDNPDLRQAGVAIVVVNHEITGEACVLLTKRPESLRRHAGQWALPGGRLDGSETLEQAALRELHEELRLELAPDNILGLLDDFPTRSGFVITPVVSKPGRSSCHFFSDTPASQVGGRMLSVAGFGSY